jgi:hypothetical protein
MSCCRKKTQTPCSNCRRTNYQGVDSMDPLKAYESGIINKERYKALTGQPAPGTLEATASIATSQSWFWPGVAVAAIGGLAVFSSKKGK